MSTNESLSSVQLKLNGMNYLYLNVQGVFFHWYPPKKYGKPRLGESTLT